MATARQIEANRRNARKSTGPRTPEGKAASRMNALRHGLASVHVHENGAEFHEFRASLVQTWMPANAKEMMLVDLIADGWWRMARANRYESELLANEIEEMKRSNRLPTHPHPRDDRGVALMMAQEQYEQAFKTLFRYSDRASSKYFRALEQLEKMQRARRRDEARGAGPMPPRDHAATIPLPVPDRESELASFGATATATPAGAGNRHDDNDPCGARGPARGLACTRETSRERPGTPVGRNVGAGQAIIPPEPHIGYNLRNV